jgi:hypothetical protein
MINGQFIWFSDVLQNQLSKEFVDGWVKKIGKVFCASKGKC